MDNETIGTLTTEQHYPFGKRVWNLNGSLIFGDTAIDKKEILKLSLVRTNLFICFHLQDSIPYIYIYPL